MTRRVNPDEPYGHRGHPTEFETRRAHKIAVYLDRAMVRLERHGFGRDEAVAFIAGVAYQKALDEGEGWSNQHNAVETIERLLIGRAAKEWSEHAIILALFEIADVTED